MPAAAGLLHAVGTGINPAPAVPLHSNQTGTLSSAEWENNGPPPPLVGKVLADRAAEVQAAVLLNVWPGIPMDAGHFLSGPLRTANRLPRRFRRPCAGKVSAASWGQRRPHPGMLERTS